jgi:hypothetical protein
VGQGKQVGGLRPGGWGGGCCSPVHAAHTSLHFVVRPAVCVHAIVAAG